jgi:hypothetical protein
MGVKFICDANGCYISIEECNSRHRVKDQYPIEQNYLKLKTSYLVIKLELKRFV